jgi:hypothetical protein
MQCFPGLNQEKNSRMRRLDADQRRVQGRVVKSLLASNDPTPGRRLLPQGLEDKCRRVAQLVRALP